jgi:hypothetical protein
VTMMNFSVIIFLIINRVNINIIGNPNIYVATSETHIGMAFLLMEGRFQKVW